MTSHISQKFVGGGEENVKRGFMTSSFLEPNDNARKEKKEKAAKFHVARKKKGLDCFFN